MDNTINVYIKQEYDEEEQSNDDFTSTNTKDEEEMIPTLKPRTKTTKGERNKRRRARMRRPVLKSPLMVYNELFKHIPIGVSMSVKGKFNCYTAHIEVDGRVYEGEHVSKMRAKEIACEKHLRYLLLNKMKEKPEDDDDSAEPSMVVVKSEEHNMMIAEDDDSAGPSTVKVKIEEDDNMMIAEDDDSAGPSTAKDKDEEDFPWMHFVSLAMHYLMVNWNLNTNRKKKIVEDYYTGKHFQWKRPLPDDAAKRNPVEVLLRLLPRVVLKETTLGFSNDSRFECSCIVDGKTFTSSDGGMTSKKKARKDCAIKVIKEFWGFDYNTASNV